MGPGRPHIPRDMRRAALRRALHACYICARPGPLELHHSPSWSAVRVHSPEAIFAVCPSCHALTHTSQQGDLSFAAFRVRREELRHDLEQSVLSGELAADLAAAATARVGLSTRVLPAAQWRAA